MNVIRFVFVALSLVCYLLSGAQLPFRHYSTNDGLPSSETYSAYQDTKGYIWIATDMGVSRFDGYNFKNYSTADGLADNTIFKFYEDPKGRIWFCSFSGRLSYYYNDSIYGSDMPINEDLRATLKNGYLTGIQCLPNDTLLLGTFNGLIKAIPQTTNNKTTWVAIHTIDTGRIFLVNDGYIVTEPSITGKLKFKLHRSGAGGAVILPIEYYSFISICEQYDNSFYILTTGPAYILDSRGMYIKTIDNWVGSSALKLNNNQVWLGRRIGGVKLYSITNGEVLRSLLHGLTVSGILIDKEKGYWFTTTEDGIFYMPSEKYKYYTTEEKAIPPNRITAIIEIDTNTLFICHKQVLVSENSSPPKPKFRWLSAMDISKKRDLYYWSALIYKPGELWLSSSSGITIINIYTNTLIKFIDNYKGNSGPEYGSRLAIKSSQNNVWSLNLSTLSKINASKYEIENVINIPARAQTLCEYFDSSILIGTINGVYCYKNDSLTYWGNSNPLYKHRFVDIKRRNNMIVAATRGSGLCIMYKDTTYILTKNEGLCSNMCRCVLIDDNNQIWLGTNNGINLIRTNETGQPVNISSLSIFDGLLSNDIEQIGKCADMLWIYTKKGLTTFNPDSVAYNNVAPPVYIQQLTIDNIPADVQINNTFSHTTNFIGINFIGLTYKNAGKQQYKYQLEGYDTTWTYTTNTFVQFTKLPPGDYRFIVKCINNSGVESITPAVLPFTINTPFYKKWWFYVLAMSMFIAGTFTAAILYINRIKKREELRNETNLKIASLELQAFRAQMNPHFIFNCLNAIQDFIIKNDSSSARRFLTSFAKLIRTTLNNSRRQNVTLEEEVEFLKLYLDLEQMRFNNKFNFRFSMQPGLTISAIEVPAMILQPFVENAIRHGRIGSLDRQGELLMTFEVINEVLICSVDDNGIGYNQSAKNEYQPGNKQAHALDIINDRIKTIAEINKADIRYTIQDKSELKNSETGTLVRLFIPLNHNA